MKLWGMQIETKNMPWFAWLIISIGVMLVCVGIMVSLIRYGSVEFKAKEQKLIEPMERILYEDITNENIMDY
jgi:hypothetical protein